MHMHNKAYYRLRLPLNMLELIVCRDGGTGRRARFKIWWWQHRVGSSPTLGTKQHSI